LAADNAEITTTFREIMPGFSALTESSRPDAAPAVPRQSGPRGEPFGYICNRCSKCCHQKVIHVNPYEVARLARKFGQTTGEFRAASTRDGAGTTLRQTETGACVFLGDRGCTVHADRPLVCRLYPLGRHVRDDGSEFFSRLEGHPQSAGEVTDKGTIAEFLQAQGAAPFVAAADDYFRWFCAAREQLGADVSLEQSETPAEDADLATDLIDMDAAIARHCAAAGTVEPHEMEDRKYLHLQILYGQIEEARGGPHDER